MPHSRFLTVAAIAFSSLCGAGCAVSFQQEEDADEPLGTSEEAVISMNRLSLNRLSLNGAPMRSLSRSPLTPDGSRLTGTDLLQTHDSRELLSYAIQCAMPQGTQLRGKKGGTTFVFQGRLGLAPGWQSAPLQQSEQRWVTACLLAHANGHGESVPISLSGSHQGLQRTAQEAQQFSVEEASFYGNVFDNQEQQGDQGPQQVVIMPDGAPDQLYSCAGKGMQSTQEAGQQDFEARRACAPGEPCQLQMTGACYDMTPAERDSCQVSQGGQYTQCHSQVAERPEGWSPSDSGFQEVITVNLRQSDFHRYYGDPASGQSRSGQDGSGPPQDD